MATWDVFHSDRLEVERSLSTAAVRAALARGDLHDDDLARPAGTTTPWARLADLPAIMEAEAEQAEPIQTADAPPQEARIDEEIDIAEKATDELPYVGRPKPPPDAPSPIQEPTFQPLSSSGFGYPEDTDEPEALPDDVPVLERDEELEPFDLEATQAEDFEQLAKEEPARYEPSAQDKEIDEPRSLPPRRSPPDQSEHAPVEPPQDKRAHPIGDPFERGEFDIDLDPESHVALPVVPQSKPDPLAWPEATAIIDEEAEDDEFDPQDEDEDAASFTLARSSPERVEELDLAAMVDVAFQMVLFFLVTATTVLYKTLELPRNQPDKPPGAVAQGQQQQKSLDDLKNDHILVEIDSEGAIKLDHEPVGANELVERLRNARAKTGRTSMLLSADFTTLHRTAVLAYDAANEIGLKIAIARPTGSPEFSSPPASPKTSRPTAKQAEAE